MTIPLEPIPALSHIKMLGGSEEVKCYTSAKFHVSVLVTWILTDTRRFKNIQKETKFGWKIRIQQRPDKQTNEKDKQTFLQHLPILVWHVVKSFEVFISQFICWKHMHMQISYRPVV